MALCHQAASHYLSQCWPRYMASLGHNKFTLKVGLNNYIDKISKGNKTLRWGNRISSPSFSRGQLQTHQIAGYFYLFLAWNTTWATYLLQSATHIQLMGCLSSSKILDNVVWPKVWNNFFTFQLWYLFNWTHSKVTNRKDQFCTCWWSNTIWCHKGHNGLTHCGPVTPYGGINLGQHCLKQWLVAWWNQAIT